MDLTYGASSVSQRGDTQHIRYAEHTQRKTKTGKCPACGKRRTRSCTFTGTVNPFNVNAETGQPKTYIEVRRDLLNRAEAWTPDFTCAGCEVQA